jgi:UPF0755 protein
MRIFKIILAAIVLLGIGAGIWGYSTYKEIYNSNVDLGNKEYEYLYIPSGSDFDQLISIFESNGFLKDVASFKKVANLKSFAKVKAGRYKVPNHMSNNALIGMLRIGDQSPVNITFNHIRTLPQLAGKLSKNIEVDSLTMANILLDKETHKKYGFNKNTFISMFLANTYEVFWDISPESLLQRMATEYKNFWNKKRKKKARKLGLSQSEVATLASIVQLESLKADEQPTIAGVYLNRLKKRMPLQADPTVIYAIGDFSIRRVLKHQLKYNSPYNTYIHSGLPPGPIYLTSPTTIDAVLDYQKHNYIYFCAKEDFSGYHNFATSYNQHLNNARKYQRALSRRKIYN